MYELLIVWNLLCVALGIAVGINALRRLSTTTDFVAHLHNYNIRWEPEVIARGWLRAEVVAGFACVVPLPYGTVPLAALVAAATGAVSKRMLQGASHPCGCTTDSSEISWTLVRNNALLIAFLVGVTALRAGFEAMVTSSGIVAAAAILGMVSIRSMHDGANEGVSWNQFEAPEPEPR